MKRELGIAVLVLLFGANARVPQSPVTKPVDLTKPTVVGNFLCAPGHGGRQVRVFEDGALAQCELAERTAFFGHAVDAGTFVYLRADGSPESAWLPWNTRLDGHLCRGTGYRGWSVDFHRDGRLRGCYLAEDETIQGVPCRKGTFGTEVTGGAYVAFHPNGRLQSCAAARDVTIGAYSFESRSRVRLGAEGAVLNPALYAGR